MTDLVLLSKLVDALAAAATEETLDREVDKVRPRLARLGLSAERIYRAGWLGGIGRALEIVERAGGGPPDREGQEFPHP